MDIPLNEVIYTDRLLLRFVSEDDFPHLYSTGNYVGFTDGMPWESPQSIAELHAQFDIDITNWQNGTAFTWTIDDDVTNEFVGRITINKEISARHWAINFWIHPIHQNKGFGTESAKAIVKFGFTRLRASTISATHPTWSIAGKKILERSGMKLVGQNPCGFKKRNQCVAVLEYEITEDQWY